jgi:hypothetical protein
MADISKLTETERVTTQDLAEAIAEFEQYRQQLINDMLEQVKQEKMKESIAMAQLEPELAKIDAILQNFRNQQVALSESSFS